MIPLSPPIILKRMDDLWRLNTYNYSISQNAQKIKNAVAHSCEKYFVYLAGLLSADGNFA